MGKTVLIVDNQPVIREFLVNLLSHEGYTAAAAEDGLSALSAIKAEVPDVLITDLVMPNIDGEKLCRIVRGSAEYRNIFVIILSAIAAEEEINLRELGANACIAKGPLNKMKDHVLAILSRQTLDATDFSQENLYGTDEIYARKITRELLSSKRHTEVILKNMAEGIIEVTQNGDIISVNGSVISIMGEREEALLGHNLNELAFRINGVPSVGILSRLQKGSLPADAAIFRGERQLGVKLLAVEDDHRSSMVVLVNDITEQKRAEAEIKRSLAEKEVLLKEVHHRVKNNLSMVASLITLQSEYLKNRHDVEVFQQIRDRISSISLVHEQLYLSEDLTKVDFGAYVKQLTANLLQSVLSGPKHIELTIEVEEARLDINASIPLGLIIAELFTNSVKYAFKGRTHGSVTVRLERRGSSYVLTVEDDGIGLPKDISPRTATTLGFQLVYALALQLNAKVTVKRQRGTTIAIHLPPADASG